MRKTTTKKTPRKRSVKTLKNLGGRPTADDLGKIDWEKLQKLCFIHCTGEEIAGIFEIDYDTLNRNIQYKYGFGFADYFKRYSAGGKASLRRRQFQMAESNPTMAIWLGKQYLGQTDKAEEVHHVFSEEIELSSDRAKLEEFKI